MPTSRLGEGQIRHLVRQKNAGVSASEVAAELGITPRHARRLRLRYCTSGNDASPITPRKPGRHAAEPPAQKDIDAVLGIHEGKKYVIGVVRTKRMLAGAGHNTSYRATCEIMKKEGLTTESPAGSRRRKWVRYERRHSNAMWHVDWHAVGDPCLKGLDLVAYLDDASRCIAGFGLHSNADSVNATIVLRKAVERFGRPATMLSDNGRCFVTMRNSPPGKKWKPTAFENELLDLGTGLTGSRPYHPQTNGRPERFFRTLEAEMADYDDVQEFIDHYNEKRLHFPLDIDDCETPLRAFHAKTATEAIRKGNPKRMEEDINDRRT